MLIPLLLAHTGEEHEAEQLVMSDNQAVLWIVVVTAVILITISFLLRALSKPREKQAKEPKETSDK